MPKAKFSDRWLRGLSADTRTDFYDQTFGDGHGQFGVRVSGDKKQWFFLYYPPGQKPEVNDKGRSVYRRRRVTLGLYVQGEQKVEGSAALTLAEARALAKEAEAKIAQGVDPFPVEVAAPARQTFTVRALWAEYRAAVEDEKVSVHWEEQFLRRYVFDFQRDGWPVPFGEVDPREARRTHLKAITKAIIEGGAPTSANRVKTAVSACFTWAAAQFDDDDEDTFKYPEANPFLKFPLPTKPRHRERWLAEHELRPFWMACQADESTKGSIALPLILLTLQRPGEVLQMRRSTLDLKARLWAMPAGATKSRRPHVVPLSEPAARLIEAAVEACPAGRDLLFVSRMPRGGRGTPAFHPALVHRVRQRWQRNMVEAGFAEAEGWHPHDLRRTGRTHAGRMGLSTELLERIMGHVVPALIGTYDQHDYLEERRRVLEQWGAKCMRLMLGQEEPGGVVVTMPRRSA